MTPAERKRAQRARDAIIGSPAQTRRDSVRARNARRRAIWSISPDNNAGAGWWPTGSQVGADRPRYNPTPTVLDEEWGTDELG